MDKHDKWGNVKGTAGREQCSPSRTGNQGESLFGAIQYQEHFSLPNLCSGSESLFTQPVQPYKQELTLILICCILASTDSSLVLGEPK